MGERKDAVSRISGWLLLVEHVVCEMREVRVVASNVANLAFASIYRHVFIGDAA